MDNQVSGIFSSAFSMEISMARLLEKTTGKKPSPYRGGFSMVLFSPGFFLAVLFVVMVMLAPVAGRAENLLVCEQPSTTDGDTFRCADGIRIRVWGVDAPERATPAGPAATRVMAELITGQTLACVPKGKSYDRIVAQCFVVSQDVGAVMVASGHARDCAKFSGGRYLNLQVENSAAVRDGKVKC